MELILSAALILILANLALRALLRPVRWLTKLGLHWLGGFCCLFLLHAGSASLGLDLPINPLTVGIAGFGGIPGLLALILLELV